MHRWILALSLAAAPAHAQTTTGTIDPGMTKQQVIERLGKPATIRSYEGTTYMLYPNKCGRTCGMQDLVILDHDAVIDAVFRSADRHYTGSSSSPVATRPNAKNARSGTLQVTSPAASSASPTPDVRPGSPPRAETMPARMPADSTATTTSVPPVAAPPPISTAVPEPAPASPTNTPVNPQTPPPSAIPHKGAVPAKADSAMAPFQGSKMSPEDSAMHSAPPNTPPAVNTTTPPGA